MSGPEPIVLSRVVPVCQEPDNAPEFLRRTLPVVASITPHFEVIFALDPSPDRTEASSLREAQGRAFPQAVLLSADRGASARLPAPAVKRPETAHVLLGVRDTGTQALRASRPAIGRTQP